MKSRKRGVGTRRYTTVANDSVRWAVSETGGELKTESEVDGMCSVWAIWIGPGPGPRICSTDRHGTGTACRYGEPLGPLDAGLRRFEFTAMERVERAIASADCSFRQPILTVAILARQRQERPSAIRAGRRCEVRSHLCLLIVQNCIALRAGAGMAG